MSHLPHSLVNCQPVTGPLAQNKDFDTSVFDGIVFSKAIEVISFLLFCFVCQHSSQLNTLPTAANKPTIRDLFNMIPAPLSEISQRPALHGGQDVVCEQRMVRRGYFCPSPARI